MIYIYEHPSLVIPAVEGGLELCSCGYPAPDKYLRWGDVYVAGALAELELGPSARNIAGASLRRSASSRGRC